RRRDNPAHPGAAVPARRVVEGRKRPGDLLSGACTRQSHGADEIRHMSRQNRRNGSWISTNHKATARGRAISRRNHLRAWSESARSARHRRAERGGYRENLLIDAVLRLQLHAAREDEDSVLVIRADRMLTQPDPIFGVAPISIDYAVTIGASGEVLN